MVASLRPVNPRSLAASTATPAAFAGPRMAKAKGKKPRPKFRITLTTNADIAVRGGLWAVVMHKPRRRPVLVEICPETSARDCAQCLNDLPFGWRGTVHAVTIATEPPAKVAKRAKGGKSTARAPAAAGVFIRVSPSLDVWPALTAVVISSPTHGPLIDFVSPPPYATHAARSINFYGDEDATAVAYRVVVLPHD